MFATMDHCFISAQANAERAASTWDVMPANSDGQNTMERKRKDEPKHVALKETLCFIINHQKLLMLKKSQGLFGAGKWHGLGGKVENGERPEQACIREVREESGLKIESPKYHGTIKFLFESTKELIIGYIFSTTLFKGKLKKRGPEGVLKWISIDEIPYDHMWEDAIYWLPLLIRGKSFSGEFHYNQEGTKLIGYEVNG